MKTAVLLIFGAAVYAAPALSVRLVSNVPSPQPVGTVVGLIPRLENAGPAKYAYKYSVSTNGGPFRVLRDFSQQPDFAWAPELYAQEAKIRVTVRKNGTETMDAELPFRITPRVKDSNAIVTPTSHPLVALFSAPSCPDGAHFRVAFRRRGDEAMSRTPSEPCRAGGNSAYVAGMRPDSDYQMRAEITNGSAQTQSAWMPFHTGLLDGKFPNVRVQTPPPAGYNTVERIIVRSMVDPWRTSATDLDGNIVWYLSSTAPAFVTRLIPGGRLLVHADGANTVNDMKRWQVLREVDLLGNTVRETNIGRLAEQLESRGIKSDCKKGGKECVSGFHHEAIRLPNGHTVVLAGLERMMPAGTQGSKEPVDVLGDLIIDVDEDMQVAWVWNAFDHMDLKRASLGDEKCKGGPGDDGCTPVFLADSANGWLHSNSLQYSPKSGDLIMSIPEQDWIVRIDYKNGKGSGKVLWRLGLDGDFTTKSTDAYPWFSYQHDAGYDPETNLLVLFDDGHRRKNKIPTANNRGQAWKIDEDKHTADLVLNADIGVYAVAVGSAQPLSNGGYSFESGFINPGPAGLTSIYSRTTETSADGKITYAQETDGGLTYRSFRVADLYSAPRK
jgi:arylsulfate sulfotransferase